MKSTVEQIGELRDAVKSAVGEVLSWLAVAVASLSTISVLVRVLTVGLTPILAEFLDFYRKILGPLYDLAAILPLPFHIPPTAVDVTTVYLVLWGMSHRATPGWYISEPRVIYALRVFSLWPVFTLEPLRLLLRIRRHTLTLWILQIRQYISNGKDAYLEMRFRRMQDNTEKYQISSEKIASISSDMEEYRRFSADGRKILDERSKLISDDVDKLARVANGIILKFLAIPTGVALFFFANEYLLA